jgi:TRAP-type mannitol/chloroaromatic compound transport system substrate-binding protein
MGARILLLMVFCFAASALAQPRNPAISGVEQRIALVIGNDSYQHVGKLDNARADARAIAKGLQTAGFSVTLRLDQPEKAMKEALRAFKSQISGGAVAVFYYSGHGVQLGAANYLLPTDVRGDSEEQVKDEAIPLQRVLDDLQEQKAKFSLAIIDACRNNPFRSAGRAIGGRGLAPTTAANGQMVLFSAGAGQQALDRLGPTDKTPNGLFTRVLLREMHKPGVAVDRVLRNVREEVVRLARTVGHDQVPAIYDQALGEFYFHPAGAQAASAPPSAAAPARVQSEAEIEQELWDSIKESRDASDFKEYLSSYPSGRFVALARARLRSLAPAAAAPAAAPAQLASVNPAPAVSPQPAPASSPPAAQRLRAQNIFPPNDHRTTAFNNVLRDIGTMSGGALAFESLPAGAVPIFEIVQAVAKNVLGAGWTSGATLYGLDPAYALIEGAPFGPDGANYVAWRNDPAVAALVDRMYRSRGVVGVLCGITGPHGDIWSKAPIANVSQLRGLKMRVSGLSINLFVKAGAVVNALPVGEVVPAMERGLLDAAMFLDPQSDLLLNFSAAARNYMVGQIYGSRGIDLAINAAFWDGQPQGIRDAVNSACRASVSRMLVANPRMASDAIREMLAKKVNVQRLPSDVTAALREAWREASSEFAGKSADYAALHASMGRYVDNTPRPNLSMYGLK